MIARVSGPATMTRRFVADPAKFASPQSLAHPIPTSTTATTAIAHAGRYTRDRDRGRTRGVVTVDRRVRQSSTSTSERRAAGARVGAAAAGVGLRGGGHHGCPLGPLVGHCAVHLTRRLVLGRPVEGLAAVRDLQCSVGSRLGAQLGVVDTGAGRCRASRPTGSTTAVHDFAHWPVHGALVVLAAYTVLPLTRIVPSLSFLAVEITVAVVGVVAAKAMVGATTTAASALRTTATATATADGRPVIAALVVAACRAEPSMPCSLSSSIRGVRARTRNGSTR